MPGRIHVGTSGWVYPHWKGTFYPEELPEKDRLAYYAKRLGCVEVNNTYYRLLAPEVAKRWLEEVPPGFRFAFKAHRRITHMKRLLDAREPLDAFLGALAPLKERVGVVLFQLPPFMPFDPERLDHFLGLLPQGEPWRYAFEFRHPSWDNEQTWEILGAFGVAYCIHDLDGWRPRETTSDVAYVRFHGPAGPYRGRYTLETVGAWSAQARAWAAQGRDVWCFFNNDQAGYAAWNAIEMRGMVETQEASRAGAAERL